MSFATIPGDVESRIQTLADERKRPVVLFSHLLRAIENQKSDEKNTKIFCLVEGKDAPFYGSRIRDKLPPRLANTDIEFISCHGKYNTLAIYRMLRLHDTAKKAWMLCFVDSDFDENLTLPKGVYKTPTYSIENLYCNVSSVRTFIRETILASKYSAAELDAIMRDICDSFQEAVKTFGELFIEYNTHYLYAKKKRVDIDLSEIKEMEVALFTDSGISKCYRSNDLSFIIEHDEFDQILFEEIRKRMVEADLIRAGRGKQVAFFLFSFLDNMISRARKGTKPFVRKVRISFNLNKAELLSQLAACAETPACLTSYVKARMATFRIVSTRNSGSQ